MMSPLGAWLGLPGACNQFVPSALARAMEPGSEPNARQAQFVAKGPSKTQAHTHTSTRSSLEV